MLTAHDFPSAHVADAAGMDMVLVGDSLAMVALGMEDTSEVLVEEMLLHCRSVARATKAAFTVSVKLCISILFLSSSFLFFSFGSFFSPCQWQYHASCAIIHTMVSAQDRVVDFDNLSREKNSLKDSYEPWP